MNSHFSLALSALVLLGSLLYQTPPEAEFPYDFPGMWDHGASAGATAREDAVVRRVAGPDRIGTSIEVSKFHFNSSVVVYIASSENWPDALTVGTATYNAPTLLTPRDSLDSRVADEVRRLGAKYVIVVGGSEAISDAVLAELGEIVHNGAS